jgi:hypothetical protein
VSIVVVLNVITSWSLRSMTTNDPICRERRNDRKEEYQDSNGESKQIECGARKYRVSLSSKVNVLIRRLDEPLVNILQGGLQEKKPAGGNPGKKVGELDVEVSPKCSGEAIEGTDNEGDSVGREGDLGTGRRAGSQDNSRCEGLGGRGCVCLLDVMSTDSLDCLENSNGGVDRLLRGAE